MRIKLIIFLVLYSINLSFSQPQFQIQLTITDDILNRTIELGIDATATEGIDSQLGEELLPPVPPIGVIEARFHFPFNNWSGEESSYKDYRQGVIPFTGQIEHRLRFQRGAGDSLKILYDLPPSVNIEVLDLLGGIIVNTQFSGNGSFTIPSPDAIQQLKFLVNYNNVSDVNQESDLIPNSIQLEQNFPNPFNPATTIKFAVKKLSTVKLKVFNLVGEELTVLVDEQLQGGSYSVDFNASEFASGVYFYQLDIDGEIFSNKMILLK